MTPFDSMHTSIDATGWQGRFWDSVARVAARTQVPAVVENRPATVLRRDPEPTFSVVVPCFNYARYLPSAVESCLSQQGVSVQVVVVNDCSSDDTREIADGLAAADARVVVVHNATNLGHVRTFNTGLERATGEFVVRLDADDLLTPGSLRRSAALFVSYPDVGLVYGHPRHFSTEHPPVHERRRTVSWTVWKGHDWIEARARAGYNCITTPEAVLRSSVLAITGGLDTRLRFAQDMEMWLRAAVVSDVGHVNGVDQAWHRDHPASMSVNEGAGMLTDLLERRRVFELLGQFAGARMAQADAEELVTLARRTLTGEARAQVEHMVDRGQLDPELASELEQFARETDPGPVSLGDSRTADGSSAGRLGGNVRAGIRRVRVERNYLRWTRTGV